MKDFVHPSAVNNSVIAQHLRYSDELDHFFDGKSENGENSEISDSSHSGSVKFTILRNPCGLIPSAYNYRQEL